MTAVDDRPLTEADRAPGPWAALRLLPAVALVVPSGLVFAGPLHSNGWPARLLVFWITLAFIVGWAARRGLPRHTSPVELGTWILIAGSLISVAAGGLRVLTEIESAGLVRAALVILPLSIVAIGVAQTARLAEVDSLMAIFLAAAAASALVGILQFITPFNVLQFLDLPGMVTAEPGGQGTRSAFLRVRGMAQHPIELSVISAALIPVGIHLARFARSKNRRDLAAFATLVIAIVLPMTVSRSGFLVALVALLVYGVVLNTRQRLTALVVAVIGVAVFRAAVPGLLGAIRSLFARVGTDDSISGRTDDYEIVDAMFEQSPIWGHGLGIFRPEQYFFLDNQFLLTLIEGGIIAAAALGLWFLLAIGSGRGAVRRSESDADRSRAQAVVAVIASIGISGFFFDLFSFGQVTILTFLFVGMAGALWHHAVATGRPLPTPKERFYAAWRGERPDDGAPAGPAAAGAAGPGGERGQGTS